MRQSHAYAGHMSPVERTSPDLASLARVALVIAAVAALPATTLGAGKDDSRVKVKIFSTKVTKKLKALSVLGRSGQYTAKPGYRFLCVGIAMKVPKGVAYADVVGPVQFSRFAVKGRVGKKEVSFSVAGSGDEKRGFSIGGKTFLVSSPARKDQIHTPTFVFVIPANVRKVRICYDGKRLKTR